VIGDVEECLGESIVFVGVVVQVRQASIAVISRYDQQEGSHCEKKKKENSYGDSPHKAVQP
jgi:hypothetical protein